MKKLSLKQLEVSSFVTTQTMALSGGESGVGGTSNYYDSVNICPSFFCTINCPTEEGCEGPGDPGDITLNVSDACCTG